MNRFIVAGLLTLGLGSGAVLVQAQSSASGAYTAAQATTGKAQYSQNCAGCHGANLQGGAGPALKGSSFTAKWANGSKTVDDLYYIIHTQMPLNAPGSLKESQYLAITAYILQQNGYKAGKTALSSKNLKSIKLTKPM